MTDSKFMSGRLIERWEVAEELAIFYIEPEDEFTFVPGQYATLGLEHGGKLIERAYSVVSSPLEQRLEFFIELVPAGRLTPLLFALKPGDSVSIRRRFVGRFVLDQHPTHSGHPRSHHLMAATVTGVAPYVSILRTHVRNLREDSNSNELSRLHFTVLHAASRSWELGPYQVELKQMEHEVAGVRYIPTVSRPAEDVNWIGETGRAEDVLRKYADELPLSTPDLAAYLCGHPQMIENARGVLLRARVSPERIHKEQYFPMPKQE